MVGTALRLCPPYGITRRPLSDDGKAQLARDPVDRGDRDQNHQDQERDLLPFQHPDLLGQLQADAARADDADDGGRAGIRFDEIEHLPRDDRQHLRHQAKAYFMQRVAAGSPDALDLLPVGGLDRLGKQFAERAEVGQRDRQHTGKRAEANDVDPHQRPDQRIDTADGIEETAHRKAQTSRGNDVPRRQQTERQRENGGDGGAEQRNRQGFAQRREIGRQ